jgi:hypothetical protein
MRGFNVTVRKISHRTGTCQLQVPYRVMNDTANLTF